LNTIKGLRRSPKGNINSGEDTKVNLSRKQELIAMAQGTARADFVLKDARVVNVFTEEILSADIAMADGLIVGVGSYSGEREIALAGKFVCPAFIDAHVHLESTMVPPGEVIHNALAFGTTTFIADPHEAANVSGKAGIDYILDQTAKLPANVYVMLPSCVPATATEDNGYAVTLSDMQGYLHNPRVLGLGEVMDFEAVLAGDPGILEKIALFEDKVVDGHAPGLAEHELAAYRLAGIGSDHEAGSFTAALRERRSGMQVFIRHGSAAHDLPEIVEGIMAHGLDTTGFSFCTDDKHIEDIRREGHISANVKLAVSLGLKPAVAIKMATINTASFFGLKHLGAIAPGYQADLLVLNDLEQVSVEQVFHRGQPIDFAAHYIAPPCPEELKNTVHVDPGFADKLAYPLRQNPLPIIEIIPGQIVTRHGRAHLPLGDDYVLASQQYNKAAVVERHRASGRVGVAFVAGFGLKDGAIASSVSHDSHNIIVIGDNDPDMVLAVKELVRTQGGLVLVERGNILRSLPLPIMGLISDRGYRAVDRDLKYMKEEALRMGVSSGIDPFLTLSFISLTVIPELRITTRGLFDVLRGEFLF
jgi:adenine deaminase